MKGVVLSIPNAGIKKTDVTYYLKRYGVLIFLGFALVIGMVFGSLSAGQADEQMVKSLDFLFITNFKARLEQTLFLTFAASLTSYFIFYLTQFLLGLTAWGTVIMPIVSFFKGFGTGLCAGYLCGAYGLQGLGFYLLMMLPGRVFVVGRAAAAGKRGVLFFQDDSLHAAARPPEGQKVRAATICAVPAQKQLFPYFNGNGRGRGRIAFHVLFRHFSFYINPGRLYQG